MITSPQMFVRLSWTSLLALSIVHQTESSCNTAQVASCRNAAMNDALDTLAGGGECINKQYVQYTHLCTVNNYLPNVDYCCCKTDVRVLCCRYHQDWYHFRCMETEDELDMAAGTGSDVTMIHWAVLIPAVLCPLMALAICLLCCCQKSASSCCSSKQQQSTRYYSSCSSSYASCCNNIGTDEEIKVTRGPGFSDDDASPLSVDTHGHTVPSSCHTIVPPCDCTIQHKTCHTAPCSTKCYTSTGIPTANPFTRYLHDVTSQDGRNTTSTYRLRPSAPPLTDHSERLPGHGRLPAVFCPSDQSDDVVFPNSYSLDGDSVRRNCLNGNNASVGNKLQYGDVSLCDSTALDNDVIFTNMLLPACQCSAQFCAKHMPALAGEGNIVSATVFRNMRSDPLPMCVVCSGLQPPHYDSIDK